MGEVIRRKRDKTGSLVDVGIGKRTVVKRQIDFSMPLTPMEEYELLVKAGVPVAKVYKVVEHKFRGSKGKEPVIVQQKADTLSPSELIEHAPQIARIVHAASESRLWLTDLQHFNLGIVGKLEPENRGQRVVVRDISGFVQPVPPKVRSEKERKKLAEYSLETLVNYAKENPESDFPIADELRKAVLKHLKLLDKRAKTTK